MSTYYVTQPWADGPGGNTPVTATTLAHQETGIGSAHDRIDALAVGSVLVPAAIRTSATAPAAGQLVTYDASSGSIGPIPLPPPSAGVIMSVVKGDATTNTITLTSGVLLGNASTSIVLRTVGESRALYGSASGWFVSGLHAPVVGTAAGTFAAGDDARFANNLAASLYGGPSRTVAPTCVAALTAPVSVGVNTTVWGKGGWVAQVDTDSMLGSAGGFQVINIPVAGRYNVSYRCGSQVATATWSKSTINKNSTGNTAVIALDAKTAGTNDLIYLHAHGTAVLTGGDQLYWSNYNRDGAQTISPGTGTTGWPPTDVTVRYIGPV